MRDVAHRYEAQRIRKLSGPVSRGPPLVMQKGTLTRKHTRRRTHSAPSAIVCVSVYHEVGFLLLLLLLWKSLACHARTCAFLFLGLDAPLTPTCARHAPQVLHLRNPPLAHSRD
jgi:hypothetical protein